MKRFVVALGALSLLVLTETVASAQITQEKGTKTRERSESAPDFRVTNEQNGNYAVEFEKEAIDATLDDGTIPRIRVHPVKGFGQLARPRLHFVPELLKSVEIM
ncbi:MAG TPA: hypothetical protein VFV94_05420 [Polyangiaceae bacterium]|nr:hypothetical protein [Polyangiaceae bacterium]